jgi:ADP-dependent NAD(P)H-hydrate dehydratase / NAD(P)H-hydrate epimerase
MQFLVDTEKMQKIDSITINDMGISSVVLMEKAAMAVADLIEKSATKKDRILAVCGMGNNGGDGIATARILKEKGYQADILLVGDLSKASMELKQQLSIAENIEVNIFNKVEIKEYTVIIDAIFGIGLTKPIMDIQKSIIEEINKRENTVFSIDLPSGICADTGKVRNIAVKADYTITVGLLKQGLVLYPGCEYTGKLIVADIGFPKLSVKRVEPNTFIYDKEDLNRIPTRSDYSNKGTFGRVLIIAGSVNMSGACFLSAKAAYRSGAGLVKVLTVKDNRNIIQTELPEAILSTYDPMNLKNKMEVDRIINDLKWATSIVIGPGIGVSPASDHLLDIVLKHALVPITIDADAINLLVEKNKSVNISGKEKVSLEIDLMNQAIITPHLKEMSRICNCEINDMTDDIITFAKEFITDKGYILTLKDARTIVTDGKRIYVNVSGNNGMATGGSGDVLTGIIATLLAQGMERFEAASLGVYIHGLAADYAVKEKGMYSLMASDIIEALPKVFASNYKGD